MVTTNVINIRNKSQRADVYIGRGSKWGNPFQIGMDGTREDVIEKYEHYIRKEKPELLEDLHELKDKTLGCYCKPLACHGDILVKLVREYCA